MIEISVTGLQKSFDLEKKILDGLTFQINSGERVGLLGKNGAGKTTLFRILTGEIDYDAGEVAIASDRRVGLISQIPVYPAGYTVEDVLQSAFERMRRMADEMERLSAQMAKGDESEETLRRYGELSARFEGLGGYDTATAVNKVANGLSIPADMRTRLFDTLSGGEKTRVNLGRLILGHGHSAARRADEPPRPPRHRVAGGLPRLLQGYGRRHLARPLFPGPHHHPRHRNSGRPRGVLQRQLQLLRRGEGTPLSGENAAV